MFSANSTEKYIDLLDDISRLQYRPWHKYPDIFLRYLENFRKY